MHYIVDKIVEMVSSGGPKAGSEMMVMINGFEELSIYEQIALRLSQRYHDTPVSIKIKLAKKKWERLKEHADSSDVQSMISHGWVSDKESITYYRNLHDTDILVLMGGEDEEDTGGLKNCFTITPGKLLEDLRGRYHLVFKDAFYGVEPTEYRESVDRLFKNLFEYVPGDICRLDQLAERWKGHFDSEKEFVEAFYSILPEWGIQAQKIKMPSIREVKGKASSNLLKNSHNFISHQMFKKLTKTQYSKYKKLIADYGTDSNASYGKGWEGWKSQGFKDYDDFSDTLLAFIRGENISENREKLLKVDYSIISEILYIKVEKKGKSSKECNNVTGDPLEVFLSVILSTLVEAKKQEVQDLSIIEIEFKQAEIATGFSDNDDDEKRSALIQAWKKICVHLNGLIPYINEPDWTSNGKQIEIICNNENIFNLQTNDLDLGVIKPASSNLLNKILFSVVCKDEDNNVIRLSEDKRKRDFRIEYSWRFKNESSWLYDFSKIVKENFCKNVEPYVPLAVMKEIETLFYAKSGEEFFDIFEQCNIDFEYNIVKYVEEHIKDRNYQEFIILFQILGETFSVFGNRLCKEGFYSCIKENSNELPQLRKAYNKLAEVICTTSFSENYRWLMDAFIHSFSIVQKNSVLIDEENVKCCIVAPWHPAVLQKMQDQKRFIRDGAYRFWENVQKNVKVSQAEVDNMIDNLVHMADIQGAVDLFPGDGQPFIGLQNSFGAYSLYGIEGMKAKTRTKDIVKKEAIYDDDFRTSDFTKMNADSYMIYHILNDYVKALSDTKYNLNIAFINPTDLQPIIAAVYHYIKEISKNEETHISVQLKILIKPENKGGRNYLAYWMDTFFTKEENINVKTYMNEYGSTSELKSLLNGNNDIVFHMGLLTMREFSFVPNVGVDVSSDECRFPIVYKPTPLSQTSKKRKIELSQPQFSSAFFHTQIVRYRYYSDTVPGEKRYVAVRESSFNEDTRNIIDILHEKAYWVVCIDTVMDGALLLKEGKKNYSIIGFSTGKGTYGQYNFTITARQSILETVRVRFEKRLKQLFLWKSEKIKDVTERVIREAGKLDGISLLSAINQKDYNINEFMAYVLTSMREKKKESKSVLRVIIHLDSYKHWFDNTTSDKKRPDFLMLSVINYDNCLKLKATVIECKISGERNIEEHIKKAKDQVENGLKCLRAIFDPKSNSLERRYWFAQLYRALVYAQVTFSDNTTEFSEVAGSLRNILNGKFEIEWDGEILGYCFDMDGEDETVEGFEISKVKTSICYIPQKRIQEILSESKENIEFVSIQEKTICPPENEEEYQEESEKKIENELREINYRQGAEIRQSKEIQQEEGPIESQESKVLSDIRILIGQDKFSNDIYWEFGNSQLANRHLLITGTSGQGKTYSVQTMLYESAKSNISSVIFDYTEGFRIDQLEDKFVEKMDGRIDQKIVYFTGVPINPFKRYTLEIAGIQALEKNSGVAERVANILKHVYGFGEQQFAAIYESSRTGLEKYGDRMNMMLLKEELEKSSNKTAKSVLSKMAPFFHGVEFTDEEFDWKDVLYPKDGKVTIFQLTSFVREIQVVITEFMLWDIWHYTSKFGSKEKPFIVVLDEAQNLSHTLDSPSGKILTEGRKFGWSAWYATQSLKILSEDEVIRLMQSAFKMYFKPTDEEIVAMAKQLNPTDNNEWKSPLTNLKKGQCVVVGNRIRPDGTFGSTRPVIASVLSFDKRE